VCGWTILQGGNEMNNNLRIDPHVHFRDSTQSYKETIAHGLSLAKEQGVEYVFDMPNTAKPILTIKDVKERLSLVPETEKERYFLYIGATSDENQLKEAISAVNEIREVIGIKMFAGKSTGNLQIIDEKEQKKVYQVLSENNYVGVIAVHCEKEEFMVDSFDPKNPISHAKNRPNKAEVESIKDQIKFVKETSFKGTLHIPHISTKESVEIVDLARNEIKITCGVTPHHLLFSEEKLDQEFGALFKMNPPLRSKADVESLREFLKNGKIDWIETDHAPHTIGEKMFEGFPSGMPSLYIYKKLVEENLPQWGLSEKQIYDLTFNNIKKVFELNFKLNL
jgi:dihydroorotase